MKMFVAGGAGFIGSQITKRLLIRPDIKCTFAIIGGRKVKSE